MFAILLTVTSEVLNYVPLLLYQLSNKLVAIILDKNIRYLEN